MGLDMMLYAKVYLGMDFGEKKTERGKTRREITKLFDPEELGDPNYVVFEIGYWRKANAIHQWFVENVQDGVDECIEHTVHESQLATLKELCIKAIAGDKDVLEPQSGFFFGGTERDDWYYEDLRNTIKICDKAMAACEDPYYATLSYCSSW